MTGRPPFRVGCVVYLNSRPLIEGLDGVILRPPADLADLLAHGELDVALVPAVEVLRRGWAYLPGIAVASPGKTDSVRLYHAVEIPDVRRVALDRNSRTSNMLARIVLERRYGLRPHYVTRDPSRGALSFQDVDAAVTIGDTSFRPRRVPFLDLGTEWKAFTGRPFVYALWAYRPGDPNARLYARWLRAAKERGLARIDAIARREARRLGLTPRFCRAYLTE
ncbi:MAG: menaquinone biosynthetic enzyme MqnA/MqnD family protein, partial [Planctomycetota bacterium]